MTALTALTVLIVDDEPLARRRLARMTEKLDWVGRIETAADAIEGRQAATAARPDILLLDIQMPGGSGFDVLEAPMPVPPAVVFVTAFDHHALKAFEANAVDYLTKPVEPARFAVAMERARAAALSRVQQDRIAELQETVATLKRALNERARKPADFWIKVRGEHVRIPANEIVRVQAERDYVRIHLPGREYFYQENLSTVERRLDAEEFMRIHRSTIVRVSAVARIRAMPLSALIAVLSDGSEVRVGRTYAAAVRARFMRA